MTALKECEKEERETYQVGSVEQEFQDAVELKGFCGIQLWMRTGRSGRRCRKEKVGSSTMGMVVEG